MTREVLTRAGRKRTTTTTLSKGSGRYAAMDGYRGLFVLLVIAYHFGVTGLVGGWVGINHFFVFSGFLIARILVKERRRYGDIDVLGFYRRRARRVLPAMFALVAAVLVHTALFDAPQQKSQFGGDAFATLGFFLNWRLISRDDAYFDQFGNPSPLRHAWTLSVEEQFYVVVPFLILLVALLVRRRLGRFALVMALAGLSAWWTAHLGLNSFEDQARLYYGTDTRAQALLVGVAFGFLFSVDDAGRPPRLPSRATSQALGALGALVSIGAIFTLDANTEWVYTEGGVLLFALGASLMGWSSIDTRDLLINRIFGWAPLASVGRISYGLYLYHWPVHLWLKLPAVPAFIEGMVQLAVTFALAVVSMRFLEAPFLARGLKGLLPGRRQSTRRGVALVSGVALVVGSFGLWRTTLVGVPKDVPPLVAGSAPYRAGPGEHHVALVGDSVGSSLAAGWNDEVYPDLRLGNNTMLGCDLVPAPLTRDGKDSPESSFCASWRSQATETMRAQKATTLALVGDAHFLTAHRLDGQVAAARTDLGARAIDRALDDWSARARAAGVKRIVVVNLPCRRIDADRLDPRLRFFAEEGSNDAAVEWANGVIAAWVKRQPDAQLADLHARVCGGGYQPVVNGVALYKDTLHFSERGAAMVWTWLAPIVQRADGRH